MVSFTCCARLALHLHVYSASTNGTSNNLPSFKPQIVGRKDNHPKQASGNEENNQKARNGKQIGSPFKIGIEMT